VGDAPAVGGRDLARFFGELAHWVGAMDLGATRHLYGSAADQHADLRLPRRSPPHPVAIVLHGGFWRHGFTNANTAALAVALARAGWATWNVEYRRGASADGAGATFADITSACAALREIDAPLDLDHTLAIGHSAGGQLALWLAGEQQVSSAVALAGVCDLHAAAAARLGGDAVAEFLGGTPQQAPGAYLWADPLGRLPIGRRQLLVHGDRDDRVPLEQSVRYAAAARAVGDACALLVLDGADHFDVIDPRATWWPRILAAISALISR
jgi:acetyl esterase/lipase